MDDVAWLGILWHVVRAPDRPHERSEMHPCDEEHHRGISASRRQSRWPGHYAPCGYSIHTDLCHGWMDTLSACVRLWALPSFSLLTHPTRTSTWAMWWLDCHVPGKIIIEIAVPIITVIMQASVYCFVISVVYCVQCWSQWNRPVPDRVLADCRFHFQKRDRVGQIWSTLAVITWCIFYAESTKRAAARNPALYHIVAITVSITRSYQQRIGIKGTDADTPLMLLCGVDYGHWFDQNPRQVSQSDGNVCI